MTMADCDPGLGPSEGQLVNSLSSKGCSLKTQSARPQAIPIRGPSGRTRGSHPPHRLDPVDPASSTFASLLMDMKSCRERRQMDINCTVWPRRFKLPQSSVVGANCILKVRDWQKIGNRE